MEAIFNRRSIRQYTSEPVSDGDVDKLIRAAMAAPSAGNEQPWHFIVVRDHEVLDRVPEFHPYSSMVLNASVAILVCGDLELEKYKGSWMLDCAAATENLLLAATSLGLGAVWLGVYPHEDRVKGFHELFHIPENVIPLALIPVGYPEETKEPVDRFKPERVHRDRW